MHHLQMFGVHGDPFDSVLLTIIVFATPRVLPLVACDSGEIKRTVSEHPRRDMKTVLTAAGRVAECWRYRRNKNTKCTHAASTPDPTPAPWPARLDLREAVSNGSDQAQNDVS